MAACAVLILGPTSASAQPYGVPIYYPPPPPPPPLLGTTGFYLGSDLGPSFMPDFQSPRFGVPASFSANSGVRFDVAAGYNFVRTDRLTLGGEFETGVIYNYLNTVWLAGSPTPLRGDYYQVPLLANLVLRLDPDSFVVPYFGIGAGGDDSSVRIHLPWYYGYGYGTSNDELDPAVQAKAGLRFRLNSFTDMGLGYQFLAAFPSEGRYVGTHSVTASVSMRF
jgi:opacity protein-like surface antigen